MKTYSKSRSRGQGISPRQIKIIHTLARALGMDKGDYRLALGGMYGVESSKELSWLQAEELILDWQAKTGSPFPAPAPRAKPFAALDGRPGMATGAQCRLMAVCWCEVSRADTVEARMSALNKFIKRIVGVESIRFVKGWQVEKVMKAISEMQKSKEVGDVEKTDQATAEKV